MRIAKILTVFALFLAIVTPFAAARTVIKGKLKPTVTVTGYLSDVFCATRPKSLDLTVMNKEPQKHTVRCTLMPPCAGSGYGIMINLGTGDFNNYVLKYRFDKKGNELAMRFLKNLKRKDNIHVTVTGKNNKGILEEIVIKDMVK